MFPALLLGVLPPRASLLEGLRAEHCFAVVVEVCYDCAALLWLCCRCSVALPPQTASLGTSAVALLVVLMAAVNCSNEFGLLMGVYEGLVKMWFVGWRSRYVMLGGTHGR